MDLEGRCSADRRASSFTDVQHWNTRILLGADAEWDGKDPDGVDPTFAEEFAEFRARWPRVYTQDPPDRT